METETWVERTILDQLTDHDRRYKHDYGGVEKTTDDLLGACSQLEVIAAVGDLEQMSMEALLAADAELEPEVETALRTLRERGLIEHVEERGRLGPPFETGDFGTTDVWKPTVEGRAEARLIRETYSAEVNRLIEDHGDDSNESTDEISDELVSLAKTYGVLPDFFV